MLQVRHWKGRQTFLGEFLAGCESADSQLDQWWILEARLPQVQSLPWLVHSMPPCCNRPDQQHKHKQRSCCQKGLPLQEPRECATFAIRLSQGFRGSAESFATAAQVAASAAPD